MQPLVRRSAATWPPLGIRGTARLVRVSPFEVATVGPRTHITRPPRRLLLWEEPGFCRAAKTNRTLGVLSLAGIGGIYYR